MDYYLDTEFLEGTQKKLFGKTKPTIDLISIGLVAEDGREYYAISKDFNLKEAWNRYDLEMQSGDMRNLFPEGRKIYWIRENVLKPIFVQLLNPIMDSKDNNFRKFNYKNFKVLINKYGKPNKQISDELHDFCISYSSKSVEENNPKFYTYYGAYDWVVFCWLFGKMIDLPKGFPMYSNDLKQIFDEMEKKQLEDYKHLKNNAPTLKQHVDFPIQINQHNALADAKWNQKLHRFLKSL